MPELKYKDITEKIIGASFEVHKIYYKNLPKPIGKRRADFVVNEKVLVEL